MKKFFTLTIFSGLLVLCVSCQTSPHNKFNELENGSNKGLVLHHMGNPTRTYRKDDADHWLYLIPNEQGEPIKHIIIFKNGLIINKEVISKPNYTPI